MFSCVRQSLIRLWDLPFTSSLKEYIKIFKSDSVVVLKEIKIKTIREKKNILKIIRIPYRMFA